MKRNNKIFKIKILIIEDEVEERRILLDFLSKDPNIEICTFLSSGFDIVSGINFHKPDVVITDFLATDADGTKVLDKIYSSIHGPKPGIIVTSSLDNISVLEKSFSYGIDYYIRKPIILSLLQDAIITVSRGKSQKIDESMRMVKIKNIVKLAGIPLNVLGYTYIVESLKQMIDTQKIIFLSEIYKIISQNHNTSVECVEVSIRNAIKKAIKIRTPYFNDTFSFCDFHPSSSIFLACIKEILLESNS